VAFVVKSEFKLMCGISVVIGNRASPEVTRRALRMHAPIRHRGPDGEGFLFFDGKDASRFESNFAVPRDANASVAFAFRRLKIVDLTDAAAQPMRSSDGQLWIIFNGEIYNFKSLRSELAVLGRAFATSGDTEVFLAAYERWGEDCFRRLEGMWSAVILDVRKQRVVACRDRFGIKPLYYCIENDSLLLASESRQILAATRRARANPRLVRAFLAGDRDTVLEETFFEGIHSVPPGCWFSVPLQEPIRPIAFQCYWDLDAFSERSGIDYREAVAHVGQLMTESVRSHSVADVRVGSLLSGGLDSSTIATLLVREQKTAPTFSFGFRSAAPQHCELPYVDTLARVERMENHETTFSPGWVAENAERVVTALEEPPLAMPALAQFRTFELCSQHGTTVILDGQGSDEIFAGYPYHERLLLIEHLRHAHLIRFIDEGSAIATQNGMSTPRLLAKAFVQPRLHEIAQRLRGQNRWINPDYGSPNGYTDRSRTVNERLHHDVKRGNAKIILGYADKNAMNFSIEARVPYFDRRLVEYAFTLPAEFKVSGGIRKRVLRDFARTFLPAEITERTDRMGFATPDAGWLRGPLWPVVRRDLIDSQALNSACFDSGRVRRLLDGFERGENRDARALWRIWMLSIWTRSFAVAF
jgi:asparagine synthase (glutamine-hydrolysing)